MKVIDAEGTGLILSQKMEENKYSVRELAEELSISRMSIYHWLYGRNIPTVDNLINLASIFGCKMEELIKTKEV